MRKIDFPIMYIELEKKEEKDIQRKIYCDDFTNYKKIIEVLNEKIKKKLLNTTDIFGFQDVPWYWDIIGNYLFDKKDIVNREINKRGFRYFLHVKACQDYQFIDFFKKKDDCNCSESIISPFFHEDKRPDYKSDSEQIRGYADTILLLSKKIVLESGNKMFTSLDLERYLRWFELKIKTVNISFDSSTSAKLKVEIDAKVYSSSDINLEKKTIILSPKKKTKGIKILVASKNVRNAIHDLALTWHDPPAKSVLLNAWSGSGKEILKDLYRYATKSTDETFINLSAPELASQENPIKKINDVLEVKNIFNIIEKQEIKPIFFIDEIHHDDVKRIRTLLLRIMESEEYYDETGKLKSLKGVRYLFAASAHPMELAKMDPVDFNNRIERRVLLKHPLLLENKKDRKEVLKYYFLLFWEDCVDNAPKENASCLKLEKEDKKFLFDSFAKEFESPLIPIISMRTIRTIVKEIYRRILYIHRTEKNRYRILLKEKSQNEMEKEIYKICKAVIPEMQSNYVF